jgi:6-phosphogluconolactonase
MSQVHVQIYQDGESLSKAVADHFTQTVVMAIHKQGYFRIVLTGGNTVRGLYELLATPAYMSRIDWSKGFFFWGDERMVPPENTESNYGQADQLFLHSVGARPERIYRIRGELEPIKAAEDYTVKLREIAPRGMRWPHFDLVLLGMGTDGHIASIFPGEIKGAETGSPVIVTDAEYHDRPAQRVSMTPMVLNSTERIFFLVTGENKAIALEKVLSRNGKPEDYPALRIHPAHGEVIWFIDAAAASLLPEELLR